MLDQRTCMVEHQNHSLVDDFTSLVTRQLDIVLALYEDINFPSVLRPKGRRTLADFLSTVLDLKTS